MISVVILHKNEKDIERCLQSVDFADEIIIIFDEKNKNLEFENNVKNNKRIKIFYRKLNNDFSKQRNYGLNKTKGDWILFLDSDEEITPELKQEIINEINNKNQNFSAYYIKRRDFFWGREVRFGEVRKIRSEGIIRLVKKNSGYWQGKVHEEYKVNSGFKIGKLKNFINHYPHQSLREFINDVNYYSTLRSLELQELGKKTNVLEIIFFPFFKFILTYFIYLGFLDGEAGFVYSFMMSFHSFLVRAKLYQRTVL
ncbi:MAG: beta-1,4-glucosyltransferase [Patescibacteria group bacterium]|nr:MAG: beta-1,4-glucosyltransferase [Patescibacteria group bacterium]